MPYIFNCHSLDMTLQRGQYDVATFGLMPRRSNEPSRDPNRFPLELIGGVAEACAK